MVFIHNHVSGNFDLFRVGSVNEGVDVTVSPETDGTVVPDIIVLASDIIIIVDNTPVVVRRPNRLGGAVTRDRCALEKSNSTANMFNCFIHYAFN